MYRPFDGYGHDTLAVISKFHESTGWEPEINCKRGVDLVCEPYLGGDQSPVANLIVTCK